MSWLDVLMLVGGLALLVGGAEGLVRGATRLALALGVTPLVVGLTVVAFGTSAPELAISVLAGWRGESDLALGNVVGSNIFNVLLILGVSALIVPLVVAQKLVRLDVPLMIAVSFAAIAFGADGRVGPVEGVLLVATLLAYTFLSIRQSRAEPPEVADEYARELAPEAGAGRSRIGGDVLLIAGGLVLLVAGSRAFVAGAVGMARAFGVSELLIGLTIVAAGTSLPEVATSVVAAIRGERDIAVGNVVGSNLFNLLGVLGITALVTEGGVEVAPSALEFDMPVMVATAVACLPIFFTGYRISRWEGFLFLAYYVAYLAFLVLDATGHAALHAFREAMLFFVLPLTAVSIAVTTWRAFARGRGSA